MKILFRTLAFHLLCIIFFTFLYQQFSTHFANNDGTHSYNSLLDFVLLSTTVQAGVGVSDLYPITSISKIVMILQQLLMLSTHVFTLYIFTL
uniref:Potassium channel domain-containing protein n=1 Tax=viral metagenome TaxID=1070528 RepID=A0A6C0E3Y4_9ZZZZ